MSEADSFKGYSKPELQLAFDKVSDPKDWRAPIAYMLQDTPGSDAAEQELALIEAAIQYYTATTPTISYSYKRHGYIIKSVGYRMGPAGP